MGEAFVEASISSAKADLSKAITYVDAFLLLLFMIGIGKNIVPKRLKAHLVKPKGVVIGLVCQFVILPPLAFMCGDLLELDIAFFNALVITCCCPGGTLSNILCFVFKADVSLSVAMTTVSSFVALVMLPINVRLYTNKTEEFSMGRALYSTIIVVAGISIGILIRYKEKKRLMKVVGFLGGSAAITLLVRSAAINSVSEVPFWAMPFNVLGAILVPILSGILLGFGISYSVGLESDSCVAVAIETSVQNKILAMAIISIAISSEKQKSKAMAVPIAYGTMASFLNLFFVMITWKLGVTRLDRKLPIHILIKNTVLEWFGLQDFIENYRRRSSVILPRKNKETATVSEWVEKEKT